MPRVASAVPRLVTAAWTSVGRGGRGQGGRRGVKAAVKPERNGSFGSWLIMLVRSAITWLLYDGTGRVLDQVGQRRAEVAQTAAQVGVAALAGRDRRAGDRVDAGGGD